MRHESIMKLYPQVQNQTGDLAFDSKGKPIVIDETKVAEEVAKLEADFKAMQYQRDRANAYPSWQEQLDNIFHNGIDAWKADIQAIKDQFPKP